MNRDANRFALLGNRPRDRLANPPACIGAEFEAAVIIELVHCPHQANVALLDEVKERQTSIDVFLGDANHQAQIRLHHSPLGLLETFLNRVQFFDEMVQNIVLLPATRTFHPYSEARRAYSA